MKNIKKYYRKKFTIVLLIFILSFSYLTSSEAQSEIYINKIISLKTTGVGYDISIQDNYAFLTGNDGYVIVNIENPSKPKIVGEFLIENGAFGIFVKEDLVFTGSAGAGLIITNISEPSNPTLVGQCAVAGVPSDVYVEDNYAYLTNYESGLQIFDISNLSNPILISQYSTHSRADKVIVSGTTAYVAFPEQGLMVVNISDHSNPALIRTLYYAGGAKGLDICEDMLFLGLYSSMVIILNITTRDNPTILGTHSDEDGGEAQGVAGNSTHLFVADNFGVEYLDISNLPLVIKKAENRRGLSAVHEIDYKENFLFAAGGSVGTGLIIFELSQTQKSTFLGIYIGVPLTILVVTTGVLIYIRNKRKGV